MPKSLKQNGTKIPNVKIQKTWINIPIKPSKGISASSETYLVSPRVADYIEKLENLIQGDLPKLKNVK